MANAIHSPTTDAAALDTIYSLLSDRRRRSVVAVLSDRNSPIELRELATAVTETASDPDDGPPNATREVVTTLHHVHLPKLDAAGVIDYDSETNTVVPRRTAALVPAIER